ncbi:hypothetical protein, partial [Cereibacter ovatus]|uniref:hypothetical protein n=1 Tax=Cereibacter ovatus TaxID=439529 RepID=UPI00195CBE96
AAPPQPNPKNRRRSASVSRYLGNTQKTRKRKNKQIHMTHGKPLISNVSSLFAAPLPRAVTEAQAGPSR